jgi:hypothetical protein
MPVPPAIPRAVSRFWAWYGRHYTFNVTLAATLFVLQIVHLVWLGGEVVAQRASGDPIFQIGGVFRYLLVFVDWTEIPALISATTLYLYELRKGFRWKPVAFLVLLNSQYLHIFWITDELVVRDTIGESTLPGVLAWIAILIDYLEVPVIVDTVRQTASAIRERGLRGLLQGAPVEN